MTKNTNTINELFQTCFQGAASLNKLEWQVDIASFILTASELNMKQKPPRTTLWVGLQTGCGKSVIMAMMASALQKQGTPFVIATATELLVNELRARYFLKIHFPEIKVKTHA